MRIGSKLQFEVPDSCPKQCVYHGDMVRYFQGSICHRCPVFNCTGEDPLLSRSDFRDDWAEEWQKFFKGEEARPELRLT